MDAVFLKVVNASISALWVVLGVLAVRLLFHRAPKWIRTALWAVVGLRLLLPFSLESIFSLIPSTQTVPPDIGYAAHPAIDSGIPILNAYVNPVLGQSMAATPQYSVNPIQVWIRVAGWVWVLGMVAMVLYGLGSWLRIRLRVREAVKEEGVWLCDAIGSPFILGIFRPRIYLPSSLGAEERAYVLAHETAHLKRKDHWWKPLGFALLTVHWFNPLLWVAYVLLCRDIELACDEKVIASLGDGAKKPYAEALISCAVPRSLLKACPLAFGENGVKGRLKAILHYKKPAFWLLLLAVAASLAVGLCFLTDPPNGPEAPASSETREPAEDTDPTKPPRLLLTAWDGTPVEAARFGYEWQYPQAGKTVHTVVDAAHPTAVWETLPVLELRPSTLSRLRGNEASLGFAQEPDTVVVQCWTTAGRDGGMQQVHNVGHFRVDLLEGQWIYVVTANWNGRGTCQYAFVGTYLIPRLTAEQTLQQLRSQYPQYFDLPVYQGLDVYIWQMAEGSYSCGLLRGKTVAHTTVAHTREEVLSLIQVPPLGIEQMRLVLSTYDLDRSQIRIHPITMPHSSYYYVVDEAYRTYVRDLFWAEDAWGLTMELSFVSERAFLLLLSRSPYAQGAPGQLTVGSEFSVAKYGKDGTLEQLISLPTAAWDAVLYSIPEGEQLCLSGDLETVYGHLEPGTYQLQKVVTCTYADGTEEAQTYTCEFTLK